MKTWSQYPPPPSTLIECLPLWACVSSTDSVPEPVQSGWAIDQSAGLGGPPAAADSNPSQRGRDVHGPGAAGGASGEPIASPAPTSSPGGADEPSPVAASSTETSASTAPRPAPWGAAIAHCANAHANITSVNRGATVTVRIRADGGRLQVARQDGFAPDDRVQSRRGAGEVPLGCREGDVDGLGHLGELLPL